MLASPPEPRAEDLHIVIIDGDSMNGEVSAKEHVIDWVQSQIKG